MLILCTTCYRERNEVDMAHYPSGIVTNQCLTCKDIIGKGPGYSDKGDSSFEDKWFSCISERKEKLIQEGKIK